MKKNSHGHNKILFILLPVTALALYTVHIVSGFNYADGTVHTMYTDSYPLILLGEYILCTALLLPFTVNSKDENGLDVYILPLMLFSALGMMRIDSTALITGDSADHSPAIMLIILLVSLVLTAFSGHTAAGAAGTLTGTLLFPAFGLCFSPFIAAAAFLCKDSSETEKRISVLLNTALSLAAAVFSAIRLEMQEPSFDKKYIPVLAAVAADALFFALKRDLSMLPLSLLPLFPLAAGVFFNAFPSAMFTLTASISPLVLTLGTAALRGNKKTEGYALSLVHSPACYIIVSAFILHTAACYFVLPGTFRDTYV